MSLLFLEEFGRAFIPKRLRPHLHRFFMKAGIVDVPFKAFGVFFYLSILITYLIYFQWVYPIVYSTTTTAVFLILTFIYWAAIQMGVIVVIGLVIYEFVDLRIYNRTRRIEEILPEFLRYVSENLKGGMSFDRALWTAIKPQFGIISDEIRLVAKRVMSGDDVEEALVEFSQKYNSMNLTRSVNLMVETIRGGGPIADVIDQVESHLRETKELKDEMNATNLNYFIFLSFIVVVIAPLLFALSYNLLIVLKHITTKVGSAVSRGVVLPMNLGQVTVKPEGFVDFSIAALIVISVFVSLIISIIRKGNLKAGIRYVPIYTALSLLMYFLVRYVLVIVFQAAFLK
ncbi:MAG: type II secretion system F family protein [Nanoarchaeota archaeon]